VTEHPLLAVREFCGLEGVSMDDKPQSVVARIERAGLVIFVTVPKTVLEWFAEARQRELETSDWCDYAGYDSTPLETLSVQMAGDLRRFLHRLTTRELRLVSGETNRQKPRLEWLVGFEWEPAIPFGIDGAAFSEPPV
jgi:hypothetical protein